MKKVVSQIEVIKYVAEDGKEFSSPYYCELYEHSLKATKLYMVYAIGQRSDLIDIFSTIGLAHEYINTLPKKGMYVIGTII